MLGRVGNNKSRPLQQVTVGELCGARKFNDCDDADGDAIHECMNMHEFPKPALPYATRIR